MQLQGQQAQNFSDYLAIVRRRLLWFLIPAATIFLASVFVALVLPAVYESQAVILIEEQEVPPELVRSTITSYADQQIQVTEQRVLTIENVSAILQKFNLYQTGGSEETAPSMSSIDRFVDNVDIDLVSADIVDPRSGRPREATIAFTLSFTDERPKMAKQVAEELVALFIEENKRGRVEQAAMATEFLAAEAEELNVELLDLEQELADFKVSNEGSLPSQYQFNLATLERTERELYDVSLREEQLKKREIELSAKIIQLNPTAPVILPSGDIVMSDLDRLRALQAEYQKKASLYKDSHPDVIRLKREIQALQEELGVAVDVKDLRRQLTEQEQKLAELRSRYNDNYHEVQSTLRIVEQLRASIKAAGSVQGNVDAASPVADNPAYLILRTELDTIAAELKALEEREIKLKEKIDHYELLIQQSPEVEKAYQALLRNYQNATEQYQDTKAKLRAASVAESLEQKQRGDRFTLMEPPRTPDSPISPNRPAIIFLGFVLAIGAGSGLLVVREMSDDAIHGATELASIVGDAPLVAVPYIDNQYDISRRRYLWQLGAGVALFSLLLVWYLGYALR